MRTVREGDVAVIDYHASLVDDGQGVVATENGRMRLRAGDCGAAGGIDIAVMGMAVGQRKKLLVPSPQAFGERDPSLVTVLPRDRFHAGPDLKPGSLFRLHSKSGKVIEIVARRVGEDSVTVDANPPLAGMTLDFDMTVVAIESN